MARVVVVGSINVDLVVTADRLPRPGETVLGGRYARHFGGKGANQAVAAARAGATVLMVGAVGDDRFGDESLQALTDEGVDVSRVRRVDLPTGVAIIAVATDGQNQIVVAPGANAEVSTDDAALSHLPPGVAVLLASLEVPVDTVVAAVASAHRLGLTPIVNPAPARALPAELLAHRPILTPNEDELLAITGTRDLEAALAALAAAGSGPVVVTRGAVGALLADGTQRIAFPADEVRVVDATGAGDTFSGVMAAWLADGRPLPAAVAAATVAAGLSVGQPGARGGMPMRTAIEAALG